METIVCPHCETKLRLGKSIAPGSRVRCPKCSTVFAPDTDEENVEIFVDSPPAKAKKPSRPADEDLAEDTRRDRSGRRTRLEYDDREDDERGGRSRGREEDDDDLDDRPVRRKRRRKKTAGSGAQVGLIVALVVGGLVVFAGVGTAIFFGVRALSGAYEKHEAAVKELLSMMTELADALETVKDQGTARVAAARIQRVCDRMEQLEASIQALPRLNGADEQRLSKKYDPEFQKIYQRTLKVAFEAAANAQGEPEYVTANLRLKTVGERLERRARSR
jgi:predicted Zn finger-like uncharacterized protein